MTLLAATPAFVQTSAQTILVHAHRGGRAYRPENTLPSFRYGIGVGADVMELDLSVTKDDVLVISHSPYLTQAESSDPRIVAALAASATATARLCRPEPPSARSPSPSSSSTIAATTRSPPFRTR